MLPVVEFEDIEAVMIDYLKDVYPDYTDDDITVRNVTPDRDPFPTRLVVVRRDGGRRTGYLEFPRLGVRAWADGDAAATDLARLTAALIVACPDGTPIVAAEQLSGPSSLPEENGKALRYMTFELVARGQQIAPLPTP